MRDTTSNTSCKSTCGPLYKAGLDAYTSGDPALIRVYAAGAVSGAAEKVYLGACQAAMFRPSPERLDMLTEIVDDVAKRYGLGWTTIAIPGACVELWLYRPEAAGNVAQISRRVVNSPAWHFLRGYLCGVPAAEIDDAFHERRGYGERCD